jgi:hypothetical protein
MFIGTCRVHLANTYQLQIRALNQQARPFRVPDVSGVGIETGDRLVVEPTGHRVQRSTLLVAIVVCAMKVADEDHPGPLCEPRLCKGFELLLWQITPEKRVGVFQPDLDLFDEPGSQRQPAQDRLRQVVFYRAPEPKIISIQAVDLVTVAEDVSTTILPKSTICAPGEKTAFMAGQEVFVVAFDEADAAAELLVCAPGEKTVVNSAFITRQGNPQIEDITEKNDILRALFEGPQHVKKCAVVAESLIDMGIADNEHR